eukprot:NODE_4533_length_1880_cov_7.165431.p9 GENE.NODE_4533_length_1880_cov_7.165431~~NODE_4533_length_1880_cov_7.165431.p9  ORF type:complete len:70 (-),score=26.78 NODE_4533_length_1880_cov_7.165431:58-267(-)
MAARQCVGETIRLLQAPQSHSSGSGPSSCGATSNLVARPQGVPIICMVWLLKKKKKKKKKKKICVETVS